MRKSIKKAVSVLLVAIMVFSAALLAGLADVDLPELNLLGVKAEAATYSGTCGDNLMWLFDEAIGELVISGTGEMGDWSSESEVPWNSYRSSIKVVTIENGVTSIGNYAFASCTGLTHVAIPDSVIYINNCAFLSCTELAGIEIPSSVTSIGGYAFRSCSSLKMLRIPKSVAKVSTRCFVGCDSLEVFEIEDGSTAVIYAANLFQGCTSLSKITLPDSVHFVDQNGSRNQYFSLSILNSAYYKNEDNWDGNFLYIDNHLVAAKNVDQSFGLEIKNGTVSIFPDVLSNYPNLTHVFLPGTIKMIGERNFKEQTSLSYVCFASTEATWNNIVIGYNNAYLDYSQKIYNHVHNESTITVTKGYTPVTCEADGFSGDVLCHECEWRFQKGEIIAALGHDYKESVVESTCTKDGLKSIYCSICGKTQNTTVIPSNGHDFGEWITVKAPTCTDSGFAYRTCEACNLIENLGVNEIDHKWEIEYTIDKAATCMAAGEKSIHCSACDAIRNLTVIPAMGHSEATDFAVEATCTANGLTQGSHCSVCNAVIVAQETVTIKNHNYGEWITVKTPTCTDDGFAYKECKDCGFIENRSVDKNGHSWEQDYTVDKAATCTSDGAKSIHCVDCKATKDNKVMNKNGHDYGEWIVAIKAECERIGVKHRKCEVCDFAQVEEIVQLNHDWKAEYTVDAQATCTADGLKSYHCTRCDERSSITVIPANGHSTGEWEIKIPTTYLSSGKENKKCTVCGIVLEERIIPKLVSPAVNIKTPSTTTINYGDSIVIHAETSKPLPKGWRIKWTADNSNFTYSVSSDALDCTISPSSSGKTVFTVTVYDENGNVMSSETQNMNSKASFFDKLSAFFRGLFGGHKVIEQVFKNIF